MYINYQINNKIMTLPERLFGIDIILMCFCYLDVVYLVITKMVLLCLVDNDSK